MKALKFFLVAFLAVSFFACEKPEPENPDGTTPTDTTTQEKPDEPKDTLSNENPDATVSFSLQFDGKWVNEGDVVEVTMDHYEWGELVAHMYLINNADDSKAFTMKEVRNYDFATYVPSFCVSTCNGGNGQKEQTWEIAELTPDTKQELAMHLKVTSYNEDYELVAKESATCVGDFTISNGEESLSFSLKFIYVKEEIPAEEE